MRATSPYITIVVYHADETMELFLSCWWLDFQDSLDFLWLRFDSYAANDVAKVIYLRLRPI